MSPLTKTIETVPVSVPGSTPSWQILAYNGVREGSFAVIIMIAVCYVAFKGSLKKFLDKHLTLFDTMQSSLAKNADSQ